jgi:hypothetical protein
MDASQCAMWLEDAHTADYHCIAEIGYAGDPVTAPFIGRRFGRAAAARLIEGRKTPFLADEEEVQRIFALERGLTSRPCAVAPLHSGFGVRGWITVRAPDGDLSRFTDEGLRLLEGLSYRASVALQKSVLLESEQASAEVASALLEFSRRLAGVSGTKLRLLAATANQASLALHSSQTSPPAQKA